MDFKLKFDMKISDNTLENHINNLETYIELIGEAVVLNGIVEQDVRVNEITQLVDLGYYFDRDIKICGIGMNVLKVETINE